MEFKNKTLKITDEVNYRRNIIVFTIILISFMGVGGGVGGGGDNPYMSNMCGEMTIDKILFSSQNN
jgi:hypothetical protein